MSYASKKHFTNQTRDDVQQLGLVNVAFHQPAVLDYDFLEAFARMNITSDEPS